MDDRYVIRRATPADYDVIIRVVDEWWGREISDALDRLFLDHFFATSAVVEASGELVGRARPDRRLQPAGHRPRRLRTRAPTTKLTGVTGARR